VANIDISGNAGYFANHALPNQNATLFEFVFKIPSNTTGNISILHDDGVSLYLTGTTGNAVVPGRAGFARRGGAQSARENDREWPRRSNPLS
jgi:hypothetical protein